nr:alpha-1,2-fucosyltransferase [Salegentibacter lacus]
MGNQMFQYATARVLAKRNKSIILLDDSFYSKKTGNLQKFPRQLDLKIFDKSLLIVTALQKKKFTELSFHNRIKKKLGFNYPKIYKEPTFRFNDQLFQMSSPVYLKGYFQSYKYFENEEKFIQGLFVFPEEYLNKNDRELKDYICNQKTVSIHIRRGDYVENQQTQEFHGNCTLEYYNKAILHLTKQFDNLNLIFFSDDIAWVKENFKAISHKKLFITGNENQNSWKDMYLMSLCNHHIIANSSFSWWGAWLNKKPGKQVIAPAKWFSNTEQEKKTVDLIPPGWLRI